MNRESSALPQYTLPVKKGDLKETTTRRSLLSDATLYAKEETADTREAKIKHERPTYVNHSHLVSWRTGLLSFFEEDTRLKERILQRMSTELFTHRISSSDVFSDSNVTGVVFKMRTVHCLHEQHYKHAHLYPEYVGVKVVPFFVDKKSQLGKFTASSKQLDRCDPTTIEARSLQILRYLILYNICPNITLLYKYFRCPDLNILKKNPLFNKLVEDQEKRTIRKDVLVIVSEYSDLGSLRAWRMEGAAAYATSQWKSIIFQVVYTLAVLQDLLEFRHNDLHQANILLSSCPDTTKTIRYTVGGLNYYLRHAGILVRLWDFDWCYCKNLLENFKVSRGKSSVDTNTPRHFDLHRFLNHVYCSQKGHVPKEVRKFIQNIYPTEYLGQNSSQLKTYRLKKDANLAPIPTPIDLLRHSYFEEYFDHGGLPFFRGTGATYVMGTKLSNLFS